MMQKDESRSGDYKQQLRPEADPRLHSLRLSQAWGLEVVLVKVMMQRRKQRKMKMVRLGKKLVGWVFYSFSSAQHWPGKFDSFFWWQRVRQDRTGWWRWRCTMMKQSFHWEWRRQKRSRLRGWEAVSPQAHNLVYSVFDSTLRNHLKDS